MGERIVCEYPLPDIRLACSEFYDRVDIVYRNGRECQRVFRRRFEGLVVDVARRSWHVYLHFSSLLLSTRDCKIEKGKKLK